MKLRQALLDARENGGVPRQRVLINLDGLLVIWEPTGEVRTLRTVAQQERERVAS